VAERGDNRGSIVVRALPGVPKTGFRFSSHRMDIMSSNLPGDSAPLGSLAEKLTIETPEQTALDFAVAGIGSRLCRSCRWIP